MTNQSGQDEKKPKYFNENLHSAALSCKCRSTTHKNKERLCSTCEAAWQQAWDFAEGKILRMPKSEPGGLSPITLPVEPTCTKPPIGYLCTRKDGHDGPCAPYPVGSKYPSELTVERPELPARPLRREDITPEIEDLAKKAVASHIQGLGETAYVAAWVYASYTIMRERELLAAQSRITQLTEEVNRLGGAK